MATGQTKPLRVVTLVDGLGLVGGGERLAREIVLRLDPQRFDRVLCVSRWTDQMAHDPAAMPVLEELREAGVRFLGLPREHSRDVRAWRALVSLLRHERVEVLHAHKFGSNAWAAALRPLTRTPVVIAHEHTWSFEGQPVRKFVNRNLVARNADLILAVSTADRQRMIEIEGIPAEKLRFLPNGIPTPQRASGHDVRAELGIPPGAPVVGTVCGLRPQKALDVLILASARLREEAPDLRVLIVGQGEDRDQLEGLIATSELADVVTLLGRRMDVPDVLAALDVAVCSSDFEGTPLSVLEYMEAALPVVATRVGGLPDLIESGIHGLLVPPQDPAALAEAVGTLLADEEQRSQMGKRGQQRRREEFDISATVSKVEALYGELASYARR